MHGDRPPPLAFDGIDEQLFSGGGEGEGEGEETPTLTLTYVIAR